MNLLLLLSALLSALSGVGQAVRGGRAPQVVCAAAERVRAVPCRRVKAAERPTPSLPRASEVPVPVLAALALPPTRPIFAGRRRE